MEGHRLRVGVRVNREEETPEVGRPADVPPEESALLPRVVD